MSRNKITILMSIAMALLFVVPIPTSAFSDTHQLDEQEIKSVIDTYFQLRYESLRTLEPSNFNLLADTSPETSEWLLLERDRQDVEIFIAKTFDTRYKEYKFFLDYQEIKIIGGTKAIVMLLESNEVYYSSMPDLPSQMSNLEHLITLNKVHGEWRIVDDKYSNEITELLETLPKDKVLENIRANSVRVSLDTTSPAPFTPDTVTYSSYPYNRTVAVAYARRWYNSINPKYHDAGNDCTNFVSQSVYEGTAHTMSLPTNYGTMWYYDFPTRTGSYPWVNVGGLYTFLTGNHHGRGPYGESFGGYLCNLSRGDVITMKRAGIWRHAVLVSAIVGSCYNPAHIRVASHSPSYFNKPLSNWSGYQWYAITILGYRK